MAFPRLNAADGLFDQYAASIRSSAIEAEHLGLAETYLIWPVARPLLNCSTSATFIFFAAGLWRMAANRRTPNAFQQIPFRYDDPIIVDEHQPLMLPIVKDLIDTLARCTDNIPNFSLRKTHSDNGLFADPFYFSQSQQRLRQSNG